MGGTLTKKQEPQKTVYKPPPLSQNTSSNMVSFLDPSPTWMRPPPLHRPPFHTQNRFRANPNYQIGVGWIGNGSDRNHFQVAPPALPPAPPPQVRMIAYPESARIWTQRYNSMFRREDTENFNTRIKDNTDKLIRESEAEAQRLRFERIKLESDIRTKGPEVRRSHLTPSIDSILPLGSRYKDQRSLDNKYFSTEKRPPELTSQMLDAISAASKPNPLNEVLVELDGVQILRKDIQTLLSLNWLNDEIVNAYMNLIVLRGSKPNYKRVYAFNTFFYPKLRDSGYTSVKRWTRKVDIFSYSYILVPVHLGNHWCLAFIDFTNKSISYYDSLGGQPNGCCKILLDYLKQESSDKKKQDFDTENWKSVNKYNDGIPQQKNCSDCGVFACTYAEYLTRGAKLKFGQGDMPYFRKKMIYEIIKKEILE